jgi:hypothetical protein
LKRRIQEAEYLLKIAETKRNLYRAEESVIKYRIQESITRVHLYRLSVVGMQEKISGADLSIGQARLDLEDAHTAYFETSRKRSKFEDQSPTKHPSRFEGADRARRRSHIPSTKLCLPFKTCAQVLMSR